MKSLVLAIKGFLRDDEGASAAEYAILAALIAAAIVIIVYWVGVQVNAAFRKFCESFISVVGGNCG